MEKTKIDLEEEWLVLLQNEFERDYMIELKERLKKDLAQGRIIYPRGEDIFSAFNFCPFSQVKAVIIGQDPYHGPKQAHGMCFSVRPGVPIPPSLANIYKELADDLGMTVPIHGCLSNWAGEGVLLLNTVLTVERGKAHAHRGWGWETFTDRVIDLLNEKKDHLVFLLWGSPAQRKGIKIDPRKHLVLKSSHPSPLSAYRGFLGCRHFSQANQYLSEHERGKINWQP